jgi:hypothetical protein
VDFCSRKNDALWSFVPDQGPFGTQAIHLSDTKCRALIERAVGCCADMRPHDESSNAISRPSTSVPFGNHGWPVGRLFQRHLDACRPPAMSGRPPGIHPRSLQPRRSPARIRPRYGGGRQSLAEVIVSAVLAWLYARESSGCRRDRCPARQRFQRKRRAHR